MKRFARMFELEDHQVLVVSSYYSEEDVYKVIATSYFDGLEISMGASFQEEDKADKMLESYTKEMAEEFVKYINGMADNTEDGDED
jgi:hypothetical protein